ncbi:MAG: glucose-1-phosphate cytidylyltransferase [Abditibacteriales bacterium]|nr:glucose-1-phosphate cytidylyltransferase [Abditibacteriales bacterium]MDW8368242.1 glucose-1-phosphate cytidylyltransferase [Abditibacteriales bacterium]
MKVILLCGGKGMRLAEHTATLPKPLIEIGGRPILWHVMKIYAHYGYRDFVLCLGYLGEKVKEYFIRRDDWREEDCVLETDASGGQRVERLRPSEQWRITFADTGLETDTGGRLKRVEPYVDGEVFFVNYSDGLSDLDLHALLQFHQSHGKIATLTAVRPLSPFGMLNIADGRVTQFVEKPRMDTWINGGFFVFHRRIFDYLTLHANLERDALARLAAEGELMAYQHDGYWTCMDTHKDMVTLNQLWESGAAFWKKWE